MGALDFLDECSNEELAPLVQFIVDKGGWTESLTNDPAYKKYHPDHRKYLPKIKNEILDFGSNTFWFQTDYQTVVEDVCKQMDADVGDGSIRGMETGVMAAVFTEMWPHLSAEDRRAIWQSFKDKKPWEDSEKITLEAMTHFFRQRTSDSYHLSAIYASSISKYAVGKELPLGVSANLMPGFSFLFNLADLLALAGPAYRVTVPVVCYIASLRIIKENVEENFMRTRELRNGDVIFAHRSFLVDYDHYGVYVGDDHVIHFSDHGRPEAEIIETSLKTFVADSGGFTIRYFPDSAEGLEALVHLYERKHGIGSMLNRLNIANYHLFSPQETIARAKGELGQHAGDYKLARKNCEHFAVWCKTGIEHSSQVDAVLETLAGIGEKTFVPFGIHPF